MSHVRTGVSQNLTGSALVNSVIAGGTVWDPAYPVKIKALDYDAAASDLWTSFWAARGEKRAGDPIDHQTDVARWPGTGNSQPDYMYVAAAAFEAVSNIQFQRAATNSEADILWMRAGYSEIMPRNQGRQVYGEGPSDNDVRQTWGYISSGGFYSPEGPTYGDWDFFGQYDPVGGIGFQHALSLVAETLGLKTGNPGGYGSPYTLMSSNYIPRDSDKSNGYGFMKTPGPIEIAAVQALYGAKPAATGNDVYLLPTANVASWAGSTGWTTIWDTGGADTISGQNSSKPVSINLNMASLDPNDPNGGGYLSRQINVYGGFNIANGVTIENATGGSGNDLIVGNEAANVLNGGLGDDTYYVGPGDRVIDSGGRDTVYATSRFSNAAIENIYVNGVPTKLSKPKPTIVGNKKKNTLTGTSGDDIISGGYGNDKLKGLGGRDAFLFDKKPHKKKNYDKIVDFNVKDDTILLARKAFKKLKTKKGELKKGEFWKGSKAHDKSDRIIHDKKKGIVYYDPDGTGSADAIRFAKVSKKLKMTTDDFFIV